MPTLELCRILRRLGLPPQRPQRRATKYKPADVQDTVREGPVPAEVFREFPERIAEEADRKILLGVDHCRIHRARTIREWLEANQAAAELYFQPT